MDGYLSELRIFSFGFTPKYWIQCNGQTLAINSNQALFSLLGTTYGGDGVTTFKVPDLRGKTMMHMGTPAGGPNYTWGETAGEATHTLTVNEMPAHNHTAIASSNTPTAKTPANNFWPSNPGFTPYGNTTGQAMASSALSNTGSSQPHENMAPFLTLNICICTIGIYPSRN